MYENKSKIIGLGVGPAIKFGNAGVNKGTYAVSCLFDAGAYDLYPGILVLGLGGGFSRLRHESDTSTIHGFPVYTSSWTVYSLAARVYYYHNGTKWNLPNLYVFGGFSLGVRYIDFIEKFNINSGDLIPALQQLPNDGYKFHFSATVGASYHLTNDLAASLEFGYAEAWIRVGVMYTLNLKRLLPKSF